MPRDTENRDPLIALRIPPALDQRLRAHAATTGATLSEIIRSAIVETLERSAPAERASPRKIERKYGYQPIATGPAPTRAPTKPPRPRKTAMCEHRVRVGNYCRRCDGVI